MAQDAALTPQTSLEMWVEEVRKEYWKSCAKAQVQFVEAILRIERKCEEAYVPEPVYIENAEMALSNVMYADDLSYLILKEKCGKVIELLRKEKDFALKVFRRIMESRIAMAKVRFR